MNKNTIKKIIASGLIIAIIAQEQKLLIKVRKWQEQIP